MPKPRRNPVPDEQAPIQIDPAAHINTLLPPDNLKNTCKPIRPADYFVTTGEVVMKTQYLIVEIETHRDGILLHPPSDDVNAYGKTVGVVLSQARQYLASMIELRGGWLWLETEQLGGGVLVCRRKTSRVVPRPRGKRS